MSAPFLKKSYACAFPSMMERALCHSILCSVAPQYPNPPELDKMRPFAKSMPLHIGLFMSRLPSVRACRLLPVFPLSARSARARERPSAPHCAPCTRYSYSVLRLSADNGKPPTSCMVYPRARSDATELPTNITTFPARSASSQNRPSPPHAPHQRSLAYKHRPRSSIPPTLGTWPVNFPPSAVDVWVA